MRVRELLNAKGREVVCVRPDAPLPDAAALMRRHNVGALVATDHAGRVHGVLGERHVTDVVGRSFTSLGSLLVGDVMDLRFQSCHPDDLVTKVMAAMSRTRCRHVPVIADEELVGIVSVGDVVQCRLKEQELETRVLREAALARRA